MPAHQTPPRRPRARRDVRPGHRPYRRRREAALPIALLLVGVTLVLMVGGASAPAAGQFGPPSSQPPISGPFGPQVPPSYGPDPRTTIPPETTTPEGPPSPEVPNSPEAVDEASTTTVSTVPPTTRPTFVPPTGLTRSERAGRDDQGSEPLVLQPETSSTPWVVFFLIVVLFAAGVFGLLWWLATRRWSGS